MTAGYYFIIGVLCTLTLVGIASIIIWFMHRFTNISKRAIEVIGIILLILGLTAINYIGDVLAGVLYATRG